MTIVFLQKAPKSMPEGKGLKGVDAIYINSHDYTKWNRVHGFQVLHLSLFLKDPFSRLKLHTLQL